jgi:hypothetical protein
MSKIESVAILSNTFSGKHKGVKTAQWLNEQLSQFRNQKYHLFKSLAKQ